MQKIGRKICRLQAMRNETGSSSYRLEGTVDKNDSLPNKDTRGTVGCFADKFIGWLWEAGNRLSSWVCVMKCKIIVGKITNICFIFSPNNPIKWEAILNFMAEMVSKHNEKITPYPYLLRIIHIEAVLLFHN